MAALDLRDGFRELVEKPKDFIHVAKVVNGRFGKYWRVEEPWVVECESGARVAQLEMDTSFSLKREQDVRTKSFRMGAISGICVSKNIYWCIK